MGGKVADRPHNVTVLLSIFALIISVGSAVVSVQSWLETRENRRLNALTSQAAMQVVAVKRAIPGSGEMPEGVRPDANDPGQMKVFALVLRNAGRSAARAITVDYTIYLSRPPLDARSKTMHRLFVPDLSISQEAEVNAYFFPQRSDEVRIKEGLGSGIIRGTVNFKDEITNLSRTEQFCYTISVARLIGPPAQFRTCQLREE